MTRVRFLDHYGDLNCEVDAEPGTNLLHVAQANGLPLEGACEGAMACSTCHVIVAPDDFAKLPQASEEEDDLLDLASHVTSTSRLACQIELTDEMETLTVRLPGGSHNWQGR